MTSPHEQEMSHPLEEVTGERDLHPEEDDTREQTSPDTPEEGTDDQPTSGSESPAHPPEGSA